MMYDFIQIQNHRMRLSAITCFSVHRSDNHNDGLLTVFVGGERHNFSGTIGELMRWEKTLIEAFTPEIQTDIPF